MYCHSSLLRVDLTEATVSFSINSVSVSASWSNFLYILLNLSANALVVCIFPSLKWSKMASAVAANYFPATPVIAFFISWNVASSFPNTSPKF